MCYNREPSLLPPAYLKQPLIYPTSTPLLPLVTNMPHITSGLLPDVILKSQDRGGLSLWQPEDFPVGWWVGKSWD